MSTEELQELEARINSFSAETDASKLGRKARSAVNDLLDALEEGVVRAATCDRRGVWSAVPWVKKGILLGFRVSEIEDMSVFARSGKGFSFVDKDLFPPREFDEDHEVRIVPGGSMIRRGAHLAKGVICMPPMYVNVGAHVGAKTMIDSHALVGSCAQVGERVHLSAAAQVGGVLEPVNANPVVVEDDVLVGGNCGVYEGTIVRRRAVLAAGVVLTRGTPVYDLVQERVIKGSTEAPLEIPEAAVVVPGARAVTSGWGREHGVSLQTPVIVKYRDEKTDLATTLEAWLR
ncbi:MAG: 2,3,4,5-tetrahydropyridine-2,6-dicarboxylate N-succinyltransferase [Gemmatimonadaceae bacterium]